jgi:hypothetical protein
LMTSIIDMNIIQIKTPQGNFSDVTIAKAQHY